MSKLYYIKRKNYELVERLQLFTLPAKYEELDEMFFNGEITNQECEEKQDKIYKMQEEIDNAMNNIHFEGFQPKAEWKVVEIINKYANLKEEYNFMINLKIQEEKILND